MKTISNDSVNVTVTTRFDRPAQEDVTVLASSYMMYKIGELILQPNTENSVIMVILGLEFESPPSQK